MGKTQFAFSLARLFKVFYVNFSVDDSKQKVYKAFDSTFKDVLWNDCGKLGSLGKELDSNFLASRKVLDIKLETIGLLWYLLDYSMNYIRADSE
jgi:hypothetical protein